MERSSLRQLAAIDVCFHFEIAIRLNYSTTHISLDFQGPRLEVQ